MNKHADLRELSNRLATDIRRFERGEVPVTEHNLQRLRSMESMLKRQRLAYKELYVYFCHQIDQALDIVDDKITRLEDRLPELPEGLSDLDQPPSPESLPLAHFSPIHFLQILSYCPSFLASSSTALMVLSRSALSLETA